MYGTGPDLSGTLLSITTSAWHTEYQILQITTSAWHTDYQILPITTSASRMSTIYCQSQHLPGTLSTRYCQSQHLPRTLSTRCFSQEAMCFLNVCILADDRHEKRHGRTDTDCGNFYGFGKFIAGSTQFFSYTLLKVEILWPFYL